jgi:DNA-binding transcriptional LysR family regulator
MELRQLRYFVAVAETGNISRAARAIFLTQPALSRQIKALEHHIGQTLLERQAHSIRLTPAGETLLLEARELLHRADLLLERVRAAGIGPRLRIGYAPSLAAGLLSAAVSAFTQHHPRARIELLDLSTAEMLTGLDNRKLDVAISVGPDPGQRTLHWTPLIRATWQLAMHRDHPLARRTRITPVDLAHQPLLIYCQKDYPEYHDQLTAWLAGHGQRPTIAGEHDGVDSLLAAVAAGLGLALVAAQSTHRLPDQVRLKKLSNPPEPLCIAAGVRDDRQTEPALAAFLDLLRQAASNLPVPFVPSLP